MPPIPAPKQALREAARAAVNQVIAREVLETHDGALTGKITGRKK
ncbi:MAG: hypothetical protein ACOZF0_20580 [Thermodesulfobacteriota bacterium]